VAPADFSSRLLRGVSDRHSRPPAIVHENALTVLLPLLLRKDLGTFVRVLRLWSIVLCANFVGTYLFALAIGHVALFTAPVHQAITAIGMAHLGPSFGIIFTRAIFADGSSP
jgi:formate-nitrite transporter family protein